MIPIIDAYNGKTADWKFQSAVFYVFFQVVRGRRLVVRGKTTVVLNLILLRLKCYFSAAFFTGICIPNQFQDSFSKCHMQNAIL